MFLAMIISLVILASLVVYTLVGKKDIKNSLIALEVVAFLVFEILFTIYHPIVGVITICGFVFFGIIALTDKIDVTPTWWRVVVYGTLALSCFAFAFQLIEVFAGRLF